MTDIALLLMSAAKTGEVLTIVYNGGSQPGSQRQIAPISFSGNKVWARCFPQNAVKSLSLHKIALPNDNEPLKQYDPDFKPTQVYENLTAFFSVEQQKLTDIGWHVAHEIEPDSKNERVAVYVKLKKGGIRKNPTWALIYKPNRVNDDGERVERMRKWLVIERNKNITAFMKLDSAAEKFLKSALEGKWS